MKLSREDTEESKVVGKRWSEYFKFDAFKNNYLDNDLYDGTCPFDQFLGGECSMFEWEYCSKCNVYLNKSKVSVNCHLCGKELYTGNSVGFICICNECIEMWEKLEAMMIAKIVSLRKEVKKMNDGKDL